LRENFVTAQVWSNIKNKFYADVLYRQKLIGRMSNKNIRAFSENTE
jgi:hypothetical protein